MIAVTSAPPATRSQRGQSLSSWLRRRTTRLMPLLSAPVFCLGLSLLALVPLLME